MIKRIFFISVMILFLLVVPVFAGTCVVKDSEWFCDVKSISVVDECSVDADCKEIADAKIYDVIDRITKSVGDVRDVVTRGSMDFFGTEYYIGDNGRVFLQMLDEERQSIDDGWCYLDAYYPNNTYFREDVPMQRLEENGLYYHDFTVPDELGNYMLSAFCSYPTESIEYVNYTYSQDDGNPTTYNSYSDTTRANRYNITCEEGVEYAEICYYGEMYDADECSNLELDIYIDTTYIGETDDSTIVGWHCYEIDGSHITSRLNENHYYGFRTIGGGDCDWRLYDDYGSNASYYYNGGWWLDINDIYFIRMNVTCIENITYNETGYTEMKGAGEVHVSESVVANVTTVEDALASFSRLDYAGGTEYKSGEEGLLVYQFIRLQSGTPIPVSDADYCNVTTYYPNATKFLDNVNMPYITGTNALYSYNFTVSTIEGIYTSDAVCFKSIGNRYGYGSSTFHVSPASNKVFDLEQFIASNFTNMNGLIISVNETLLVINNTVMTKLYGIQDEIVSVNETVKYEHTQTNNLITNFFNALNVSLTNWFNGISTQITNLNNYLNTTLTRIEWKIDNLNTTLTNLTIGNVTLTVNVDEDSIATETLRKFCHYGAIDFYGQEICRGANERGTLT